MSNDDLLTFRLEKKFRAGIMKARKKAGRKVGAAIVKTRRGRMGNAEPRRKKAVIYRVAKNGTLLIYDVAPMAFAQEFGETIRATSKPQLFIKISDLKAGEMPVRRGDYLLAVKKGGEPRVLGVYKDEVRIEQVSTSRQFFEQIGEFVETYEEVLLKAIAEEEILL